MKDDCSQRQRGQRLPCGRANAQVVEGVALRGPGRSGPGKQPRGFLLVATVQVKFHPRILK